MRKTWLGVVVAALFSLLLVADAAAGVIYTNGIINETGENTLRVSFLNYSGGGVTSNDNQGREIRNLWVTTYWADVEIGFNSGDNVGFGTSDFIYVYVDRTQVGPAGEYITGQVTHVDGSAVASGTVVNLDGAGRYALPFTLSSPDSSVTSVTIRFTLPRLTTNIQIDAFATPEPGTLALLGAGLLGAGAWGHRRRRRRKKA